MSNNFFSPKETPRRQTNKLPRGKGGYEQKQFFNHFYYNIFLLNCQAFKNRVFRVFVFWVVSDGGISFSLMPLPPPAAVSARASAGQKTDGVNLDKIKVCQV